MVHIYPSVLLLMSYLLLLFITIPRDVDDDNGAGNYDGDDSHFTQGI